MIGNIVNTYAIAQLETTRLVLQIDNEDKKYVALEGLVVSLKRKIGEKESHDRSVLSPIEAVQTHPF